MHHTRSKGVPEFSAFSEPEREFYRRLRDQHIVQLLDSALEMAEPPPVRRTVHQRASSGVTGARSSISRPTVQANQTWQIPSHVMSTITNSTQFHGLDEEDAPGHLSRFVRICDTFRVNGVSEEAIYLRLFPFTLSGRAITWLDTLPQDSISTWADLQAKFLKKYYPPSKAARLREQIHSFRMDPDEAYCLAWERFYTLLSKCPQHGLTEWAVVEKFYNGLTFQMQQQFNTAAGGHIMEKLDPDECEEMFESFALAQQQQPSTRTSRNTTTTSPSSRGLHQVTSDTIAAAELEALKKEVRELKKSAMKCEVCRGGHDTIDCPVSSEEQVDYLGNPNRGQNNAFGNSYNSGWRNHPNFSWKNGGEQSRFQPKQDHSSGEVGGSSNGSEGNKEIRDMLATQTQLLQQLVVKDKETQGKLLEHDTLLRNQQSAFLDLQRT